MHKHRVVRTFRLYGGHVDIHVRGCGLQYTVCAYLTGGKYTKHSWGEGV